MVCPPADLATGCLHEPARLDEPGPRQRHADLTEHHLADAPLQLGSNARLVATDLGDNCRSIPRQRSLVRVLTMLRPDWRMLKLLESSPYVIRDRTFGIDGEFLEISVMIKSPTNYVARLSEVRMPTVQHAGE